MFLKPIYGYLSLQDSYLHKIYILHSKFVFNEKSFSNYIDLQEPVTKT